VDVSDEESNALGTLGCKAGELVRRSIREFEINDIDLMIRYFLDADPAFLKNMGVDVYKLPSFEKWRQIVLDDFKKPVERKKFYYVMWELDGFPAGHSNINKIVYGQEAYMHLHLWKPAERKRGHGTFFIRESISRYFDKFDLKSLFCEPNALNPAPNRTLKKAGFEHVQRYETTPGWINFHQPVNRWILTREKWKPF